MSEMLSSVVIGFGEWHSEAVAPDAVGKSDATGDNHVDFAIAGQSEGAFHETAVEAFERTGVVACLAHGKHEGLHRQGATLVHHHSHVCFGNLSDDGSGQSDELCEEFAQQSPHTEESGIDERHEFAIVKIPFLHAFCLFLFRAVAAGVSASNSITALA